MAEQKTTSSPRPSNSPVLIAVVVMALAGLVGLNMMSNQMRPKTDHEIEAEQQERAKAAASPSPVAAASAAPVPPGAPGAPGAITVSDPNALVLAGPGSTLGSPDAKQEVVVGFSWTPEVQSDPSKVSKAIDALQKTLGTQGRIKVVNVDENQEVPDGVSIGGKVIVPAQSDGTIDPGAAETVKKALATAP
jgi:hypothetical protein